MSGSSAAILGSSPWPVWTTVSRDNDIGRAVIEPGISLSLKDRTVAAGPPRKRVPR